MQSLGYPQFILYVISIICATHFFRGWSMGWQQKKYDDKMTLNYIIYESSA